MLIIGSVLLSFVIVAFGVLQGRSLFGAYMQTMDRFKRFGEKLATCDDGVSFMQVTQGWTNDEDRLVRRTAKNLLRHFSKDPIRLHGHLGWVVDIDDLCSEKRLLRTHAASAKVNAMPGILMGAGILLTFLGLTIGVFGLDPTDADQLTQGVKKLLGGMSMAFLTSIAGIGTGLWWTWRSKAVSSAFEESVADLADILHNRDFILLPEEMNYQFFDNQQSMARALESLEETTQKAIRKALDDALFENLSQFISQSATQGDLQRNMGAALKDIHGELKQISTSLMQNAETQRLMGKALKRVLSGNAPGAAAPAAPGAGGFDQKLLADSAKLFQNVAQIQHSQDGAIQAINDAGTELRRMMKTARVANADVIKLHNVMVKQLEKLEAHWTSHREHMEKLHKTLDESIKGFEGELGESLTKVHEQIDQLMSKGLNHFAGALKSFEATLGKISTSEVVADTKDKSGWLGRRK